MSYVRTIIDFIQTLSLKDEEINNVLKEIDEMTRENMNLENQLEEFEREHVRLQIEYHNLETISSFKDVSAIENLNNISQKMYKDCVELKSLIDKIDFTKILQCNHMEIEAKCRKEWQPIEDCFVKTLNWHQQMEQRHIVQKYRQAEITYRETESASKNQLKSMEESLKQSIELINQAKDKRNNMLLVLIRGKADLDDFSKKMVKLNQYKTYIEGLRKEKFEIRSQLDQTHFKAFNPKFNSSNQISTLEIKPNEETSNFIRPKFPSFSDILESFNQAQKVTSITTIENSNTFCIKSILHTSKTSITTKQTKNVHFKVELEEYQEQITEIETETDVEEMSLKTTVEINEHQANGDNLQEMKDLHNNFDMDTIDLLTPADNTEKVIEQNKEITHYTDNDANTEQIAKKSMVEIQDCVIFKTPFPIKELKYVKHNEQDKENMADNVNLNHSKPYTDSCSSSLSHQSVKETLETTKNSFYEEFSPSVEASSKRITNFDNLFNERNLSPMDSNEQKLSNAATISFTKSDTSEIQDFLDFGSSRGFTFDSDDNIDNNYSENMDFIFPNVLFTRIHKMKDLPNNSNIDTIDLLTAANNTDGD